MSGGTNSQVGDEEEDLANDLEEWDVKRCEENHQGTVEARECCKEGQMQTCPMHASPAKCLVVWKEPVPFFSIPQLKLKYIPPNLGILNECFKIPYVRVPGGSVC